MYEESFDEMQWALEELERNYILLNAYIAEKKQIKGRTYRKRTFGV